MQILSGITFQKLVEAVPYKLRTSLAGFSQELSCTAQGDRSAQPAQSKARAIWSKNSNSNAFGVPPSARPWKKGTKPWRNGFRKRWTAFQSANRRLMQKCSGNWRPSLRTPSTSCKWCRDAGLEPHFEWNINCEKEF